MYQSPSIFPTEDFILYYCMVSGRRPLCNKRQMETYDYFFISKATLIVSCSQEYATRNIIDSSFLFFISEIFVNKMYRKLYACCSQPESIHNRMFGYSSPRKQGRLSQEMVGDIRKNFREWDDSYTKSEIEKHIGYFYF